MKKGISLTAAWMLLFSSFSKVSPVLKSFSVVVKMYMPKQRDVMVEVYAIYKPGSLLEDLVVENVQGYYKEQVFYLLHCRQYKIDDLASDRHEEDGNVLVIIFQPF